MNPNIPVTQVRESHLVEQHANLNGVDLEYELTGSGEPVVLIHGGLLADENTPLAREPSLVNHHTVLNYHRRGFAGSTSSANHPPTITDHAGDCLALMRHVGFDSAHIVGHSLGGVIALQLALDAGDSVRTLALLEPALMGAIAKAEATDHPDAVRSQKAFMASVAEVMEVHHSGDTRGALLMFLRSRAGEAFSHVLEFLTASGEFEQAVADADTFLSAEMPAAFRWSFTPTDAARISQPVLSVLGSHSPERPQKVHWVLNQWVPQTELLVLEKAEHALPLMDPPEIAAHLASFFAKHAVAQAA